MNAFARLAAISLFAGAAMAETQTTQLSPMFLPQNLLTDKLAAPVCGCRGWGKSETPFVIANGTTGSVAYLDGVTLIPPRGVVVHPSGERTICIGWQSPISGKVDLRAKVTHVHPTGGDGVSWEVIHTSQTGQKSLTLVGGEVGLGGSQVIPALGDQGKLTGLTVRKGEGLFLRIGPRENHACDSTLIELVIKEADAPTRVWDLGKDVAADIQAANPHADSFGNTDVWRYFTTGRPTVSEEIPASRVEAWTIATDDTKLTVGATTSGQVCVYELSNPAANWNWTAEPAVFYLARSATVDRKRQTIEWKYKDGILDKTDGQRVTIRLVCEQPSLELTSVWHARKGRGPVRCEMFITNLSKIPVTFAGQSSVGLSIAAPSAAKDGLSWRYVSDEGNLWGDSPTLADKPGVTRDAITPGYSKEIACTPGYDFIPMAVFDAGGAHGVYVGMEWSHSFLKVRGGGGGSNLTARIEAGNPANFSVTIPAGEAFLVPPALIGTYCGDMDDFGNGLRKYLFHYSMPDELRTDPTYPKLEWNSFTATGKDYRKGQGDPSAWDPVEVKYYPFIKEAAALGFEEIAVDIAWWGGNEPGADKPDWPQGMKAAGDATHKLGMRYVLYWTDAENMGAPGGRATRAARIKRLFAEHGADTWRSDATRGLVIAPDYWSVKGFYEMVDALKKDIPNFQWENCGGGGPYKDYGAMKRATKIQNHDSISPAITTRRVFFDSSYVLHPMQLQGFVGWHSRTRPAEPGGLVYDFRSTGMGAFMWWIDSPLPTNGGTPWTDEERKAIAREVNTYKTRLRPLIREADLYHVLPRPDHMTWDGMEYYDLKTGKGVVFVFKEKSPDEKQTIKLKGLDPKAKYDITFEDGSNPVSTLTGEQLIGAGFTMALKGTYVSELVWVTRK